MGYYPHNIHFLWFAATFDGRSKLAIESARKTASKVDDATLKQVPLLAVFRGVPYYALTRFGKWDEMLREPEPPAFSPYLSGLWHYARGIAYVGKGEVDSAEKELKKLNELVKEGALDHALFSPNKARAVLSIAPEVLAGEIAAAKKNYDTAIAHLERAVRLEEALIYTEPAEWHYPPRHALGAVLLEAKRAPEAETVYWTDLRQNRNNGWALFGLSQALRAQGKNAEAALVDVRLKKAWARADFVLTGSRVGRQSSVAQALLESSAK
jgi:tetratricopeptide (TPR) repeat protein